MNHLTLEPAFHQAPVAEEPVVLEPDIILAFDNLLKLCQQHLSQAAPATPFTRDVAGMVWTLQTCRDLLDCQAW